MKKITSTLICLLLATSSMPIYANDANIVDSIEIVDENIAIAEYSSRVPKTFEDFFYSGHWVTKSDGRTALQLYLKAALKNSSREKKAWEVVYNKFKNDPEWKNTQSMKDQFFCHVRYAKSKTPWNLEPSAPEGAGFWNKCNP